mgnify:FL=1
MDYAVFEELLHVLTARWLPLRDKPEETPESLLRTLWFLAAGDHRG